jgi:hypothetical protein
MVLNFSDRNFADGIGILIAKVKRVKSYTWIHMYCFQLKIAENVTYIIHFYLLQGVQGIFLSHGIIE